MSTNTLLDTAQRMEKRYGEGRVLAGISPLQEMRKSLWDYPRLPTGIFPLDYCLGGGIPLNTLVQFYGPPSSLKSTTSYLLARSMSETCMRPGCLKPLYLCQCSEPLIQKTFICQVEGNTLDDIWFTTLGYNADDHAVIAFPDYAEQACEMVEAAVRADDCGLVIVDSVGAMLPRAELEGSYEDSFVGNQARLLTRFAKRLSSVLVGELRRGHFVGVVLVNQVRSAIGGSFYSPTETTAGGYALRHGVRLSIRFAQLSVSGAGEKDSDGVRHVLRASASLVSSGSKQQIFVLGGKCEYKVAVSDASGYPPGTVLDFNVVLQKIKELDMLKGDSRSGYTIEGFQDVRFQKQADFSDFFANREGGLDAAIRYFTVEAAKNQAISELKQRGSMIFRVGKDVIGHEEEVS